MQRKAYNRVLSWTRNKMKKLNSLKPQNVEPIYLFITGGGGAGKSHLIKTIYHTVVKTYKYAPMNPEKPTVLLAAPTGVAAINIDGTTINTALALPKKTGDVLQYCAKVIQTIIDEYRALFSRFLADISAINRTDWRTLK